MIELKEIAPSGTLVVNRPRAKRLRVEWSLPAVVTLAVVVMGIATYFWDPAVCQFFPRCPMYALTGLSCPGCGGLRAAHQLLHGHLLAALALNPLAVCAAPFIGAVIAWRAWAAIFKKPWPPTWWIPPAGWICAIVVVLLLYGVLRNLPWYPWTLLAPHSL